jgi:hypothetical protein
MRRVVCLLKDLTSTYEHRLSGPLRRTTPPQSPAQERHLCEPRDDKFHASPGEQQASQILYVHENAGACDSDLEPDSVHAMLAVSAQTSDHGQPHGDYGEQSRAQAHAQSAGHKHSFASSQSSCIRPHRASSPTQAGEPRAAVDDETDGVGDCSDALAPGGARSGAVARGRAKSAIPDRPTATAAQRPSSSAGVAGAKVAGVAGVAGAAPGAKTDTTAKENKEQVKQGKSAGKIPKNAANASRKQARGLAGKKSEKLLVTLQEECRCCVPVGREVCACVHVCACTCGCGAELMRHCPQRSRCYVVKE